MTIADVHVPEMIDEGPAHVATAAALARVTTTAARNREMTDDDRAPETIRRPQNQQKLTLQRRIRRLTRKMRPMQQGRRRMRPREHLLSLMELPRTSVPRQRLITRR